MGDGCLQASASSFLDGEEAMLGVLRLPTSSRVPPGATGASPCLRLHVIAAVPILDASVPRLPAATGESGNSRPPRCGSLFCRPLSRNDDQAGPEGNALLPGHSRNLSTEGSA